MVHSHQRQLAASELQVDVPQIPHPVSHIQDPLSWPATYAAAIADAAGGCGGGADGGGTGGGTKGPPKPVAQTMPPPTPWLASFSHLGVHFTAWPPP